jgi:hypothetical protein
VISADLVQRPRALGFGVVAEPPFELPQDRVAGVPATQTMNGKPNLAR